MPAQDREPRVRVAGQPVNVSIVEIVKVPVEVPGSGSGSVHGSAGTRPEVTLDLLVARLLMAGYRDLTMAPEVDKVSVALDATIVAGGESSTCRLRATQPSSNAR